MIRPWNHTLSSRQFCSLKYGFCVMVIPVALAPAAAGGGHKSFLPSAVFHMHTCTQWASGKLDSETSAWTVYYLSTSQTCRYWCKGIRPNHLVPSKIRSMEASFPNEEFPTKTTKKNQQQNLVSHPINCGKLCTLVEMLWNVYTLFFTVFKALEKEYTILSRSFKNTATLFEASNVGTPFKAPSTSKHTKCALS